MLQRKHYDISYQHLKRSLELQPINVCLIFSLDLGAAYQEVFSNKIFQISQIKSEV